MPDLEQALEDDARSVLALLASNRLVLTCETRLQERMSELFARHGMAHDREFRLSASDRVDFMFPSGLAVEVKLAARRRAVYRQCERYCSHGAVRGLPGEIGGKPCWVASLGAAWL